MARNNRNDVDWKSGDNKAGDPPVPPVRQSDYSGGGQRKPVRFERVCRGLQHKRHNSRPINVRSPPFDPQSKGHAERFVDTFKNALEKLKDY
ncbi:hypothetical protein ANCDUO_17980 [Ancylostoma duodenale]|uniref:Uncharacterized protein n=1 Tax=Ancylostoma duodenale TaxID=51022 RepID=A0A0C2FTL9_9BILA|nr:hypothetical protein ANCDUO_17980 [Ancylostoma duodenale]